MFVSVYCKEQRVGTLEIKPEGEDTSFRVECPLVSEGLYRVWAQGEKALLLGVAEGGQQGLVLRRRYSGAMTAPLGTLRLGRLEEMPRPTPETRWKKLSQPETCFQTPALRKALRGAEGALYCRERGLLRLALPFDFRRPFLLTQLFCFARVETIGAEQYAVFSFDCDEYPKIQ